jgi:type II secretory pathway pseudopilin PulG
MPRGDVSERGFSYIGLLALVALIGIFLSAAGEVVSTAVRHERETELLWVGHEYRMAIARYFNRNRAYPQALEDLLGTTGDPTVQVRYLRRLYRDPMTNAVDWTLIPAPAGGGIIGVASSSKRAPLKTAGFDDADLDFADASSYGDWQFKFVPARVGPRKR